MTTGDTTVSRNKELVFIPFDVGNQKTARAAMQRAVADYFNITIPTADTGGGLIAVARKPGNRVVYDSIADDTGRTTSTITPSGGTSAADPEGTAENFYRAPNISGSKGRRARSKRIAVPTEKKTTKGNVRRTTMQFPSFAGDAVISVFLYEKCSAARRPAYFINTRGSRIAVVPRGTITDINPDNQGGTATVGTT